MARRDMSPDTTFFASKNLDHVNNEYNFVQGICVISLECMSKTISNMTTNHHHSTLR